MGPAPGGAGCTAGGSRQVGCSRGSGHAGGTSRTEPVGTRADLGIAPGRVGGACATLSGWLGGSGGPGSVAVVGRRASGRGTARADCDRLGHPGRKRTAGDAAGALVERTCRPCFVGRAQDRGTGPSGATVVVRACRLAGRSCGLVGPGRR
jgi:hypothetical protein